MIVAKASRTHIRVFIL